MTDLVWMYYPGQQPNQIQHIVPENFEIKFFNPYQQYKPNTVFYYDLYGPYHDMISTHLDQGHRVIFDAKNEHYVHHHLHFVLYKFLQHPGQGCFIISGDAPDPLPGVRIIATPYWYWIIDQTNLKRIGVDKHVRNWQINKKFFMSMSLHRQERDYLYDNLGDILNDSIHSYRHRGVYLPNDVDCNQRNPAWQRFINLNWLDSTAFTLVVETFIVDGNITGFSLTQNNNFFLCEKTYKPLAAQHPLLMVSTQSNLAYMRSQGFESFPELFDESYDNMPDWQQRVDRIVEIVREFDVKSVDQPSIKEKMRHNQAHFFNQELTKKFALETIQQPMFDFVYE